VADPREKEADVSADTGEPPRVINPSEGCRFRWRCPYAIETCEQITPRPTPIGSREVACHVAVAEAKDTPSPAGAASVTK
jgi:peptide/nickel transport system ATP-binding protein